MSFGPHNDSLSATVHVVESVLTCISEQRQLSCQTDKREQIEICFTLLIKQPKEPKT